MTHHFRVLYFLYILLMTHVLKYNQSKIEKRKFPFLLLFSIIVYVMYFMSFLFSICSLNYLYGVVKIGHELIDQASINECFAFAQKNMSYDYFFLQFKAVLEFEPGLYTHHQVIGILAIAKNTPKMIKLICL